MGGRLGRPGCSLTQRAVIGIIIVATLAYYYWTAICSFDEGVSIRPRGFPETDHFNMQSRGFLKGHLYLDAEVDPGLLTSPNPYDPSQRPGVRVIHDASFYRGKYYIYFGPGPVVALFLPFTVLTGRDLPLPHAVWVFSCGGFLALTALFLFVQRRYFPRASLAAISASLIALGGANMAVALLRRPNVWEAAAGSGFFFFSLSLLCLVCALHSRRAALWCAAGGLALGLSVASRPTYIVCSVMFAVPVVFHLWRARQTRGANEPGADPTYDWRALFAAAAGCSAVVIGLLVYNYARFGEPLEFGQRYQLSAIIEGEARHFSLSYVWFNARVYFFSALRWATTFPFHNGIALPPTPKGYGGYEYTIGLFPNLPFSMLSVVALVALLGWRARESGSGSPRVIIATIACAALLSSATMCLYFGNCIRYMVDFAPLFLLLAAIGLLELESRFTSRAALVTVRVTGLGLALFSAAAAALAVVNLYNIVPNTPPRAYHAVIRAIEAPSRLLAKWRWPDYGPWKLTIRFPADRAPRSEPLLTISKTRAATAFFFVEYLDARTVRFGYRENLPGSPTHFSPALPAEPGATHTLRVQIGDVHGTSIDGIKSWLRLRYDERATWQVPAVSLAAFPGQVTVGEAPAIARLAPRFTGEVQEAVPVPHTGAAPRMAGARVRLTLKANMIGRAFPLATSGVPGAGDIFFLRVPAQDTVVFGYDHWGSPSQGTEPITLRFEEPHVVEFWLPVIAEKGPEAELIVRVNGKTVWREKKPFFETSPEQIYPGLNPIGGTSSEAVLENGVFEDTQLPLPDGER